MAVDVHQVPCVGLEALELEVAQAVDRPRQVEGGLADCDSGAARADIEVDKHPLGYAPSRGRLVQPFRGRLVVDHQGDLGTLL